MSALVTSALTVAVSTGETVAISVFIFILALVLLLVGVFFIRNRGTTGTVEAPPKGPAKAPPKAPAKAPPKAPPPEAEAEVVEAPEAEAEAPPEVEAPEAEVEAAEAEAPVEVEIEEEEVLAPPTFRERLGKARGLFAGVVGSVRSKTKIDPATWDDLEEALLRADVGVATTDLLLGELRGRVASKEIGGGDELIEALRTDLVTLLDGAGNDRALHYDAEPGVTNVWLFVGVNGVGKTTTVGKVARQQAAAGKSVLLAAGDTFRAAAGEQLATWGERVGAEVVRGAEGGDPSAIVFDAVQRASARGNDVVLADTAGRLHTKVNLVEELKKIRRVADRPPGRVSEVLLVLDATTGQNGLVQARQFMEAVAVTGVVLTKLDGTAKGGVVVAVQRDLGLPVKLVGLGEGPDDLVPFDPQEFVDALVG